MESIPWITIYEDTTNKRHGVKVDDIVSANDGDVCNSIVTAELVGNIQAPYCIDIGVDQGWWSIFLCKINTSVKVDSFEPNPFSFEKVKNRIKEYPQISIHNLAISNTSGTIPLNCLEGESHSRSVTDSTIFVPCDTLDKYVGNKQITLIKIDTEGHDIPIIKSLFPILQNIQSLIFELTTTWCNDLDEVKNVIKYLAKFYKKYLYVK
jgi:FkbM family methyltransferase